MLTQAGDDLRARLHVARDGLAGERGGVELGRAVRDHAVDGHALAGLDHDRLATATSAGSSSTSSPSFSTLAYSGAMSIMAAMEARLWPTA